MRPHRHAAVSSKRNSNNFVAFEVISFPSELLYSMLEERKKEEKSEEIYMYKYIHGVVQRGISIQRRADHTAPHNLCRNALNNFNETSLRFAADQIACLRLPDM